MARRDRATYDPALAAAVNYTVTNAADAPLTLTYGPSFFALAANLSGAGNVTIGLNRRLNDRDNTLAAAREATRVMRNLYAIELGNEPEYYASDSPIIPSTGWNQAADASNEQTWLSALGPSVGNVFQAGVYLAWKISDLIPKLSATSLGYVKSFSRHSYPQSACGGASTDLPSLMSHSKIVSYTSAYKSEAALAHSNGKRYFLGETNSATCGGGGISPTFGAALWIVDYVLQAALNGVDQLYFHQGTIGNCVRPPIAVPIPAYGLLTFTRLQQQYCWWGRYLVGAPYYGAAFVSAFLGTDGARLLALDDGTGAVGVYALYNSAGAPVRLLAYNSAYYDGSGTRGSASVSFSGLRGTSALGRRLTAPNATSRADQGGTPTIGGGGQYDAVCKDVGTRSFETFAITGGSVTVDVKASEALVVYL